MRFCYREANRRTLCRQIGATVHVIHLLLARMFPISHHHRGRNNLSIRNHPCLQGSLHISPYTQTFAQLVVIPSNCGDRRQENRNLFSDNCLCSATVTHATSTITYVNFLEITSHIVSMQRQNSMLQAFLLIALANSALIVFPDRQ